MLSRRRLIQLAACSGSLWLAGCSAASMPEPVPAAPSTSTELTPTPIMTEHPTGPNPTPDQHADLDIKIGQMFMVGFRGFDVDDNHPIVHDIRQRHLGGVVLFDYDVLNGDFVRNIQSPQQVRTLNETLQSAAHIPLLIAVDQEGGTVARLHERYGFPPSLSHQALGELDDVEVTFERASEMAQTVANAGINHNLAPVVDLNVNPNSPAIGAYGRSFSADAQKVTAHARAFIQAHHEQNVLCTLKHFPGHGSAGDDSHLGFVDVTETWSRQELEPYGTLIREELAGAVMTAHVFNRQWGDNDPATLSPAVIDGLLRNELGYDGVVISDDMQMGAIRDHYDFDEAIRKTLEAGVDIIAIANNSVYDEQVMARGVGIVKQLVEEGAITHSRIDASYRRIMQFKSGLK